MFVTCVVPGDDADSCVLCLLRQQCLTPMALSCLGREELLLPLVEKVRKHLFRLKGGATSKQYPKMYLSPWILYISDNYYLDFISITRRLQFYFY